MNLSPVFDILTEWSVEINETIIENNSFCLALFSIHGELIFGNPAFNLLIKDASSSSFVNPTFQDLSNIESNSPLIFDGFLTIGGFDSLNNISVNVQVHRKKDKLLIVGGIDSLQLIQQNNQLVELNKEIGALQREIIKKTHVLENAVKQLDESNLALKKEQQTRDQLFSIIAHDLRSPFNTILGFSEHLTSNLNVLDQEGNKKLLDNINTSAKNTLTLLDNLLSWSKAQTGQLEIKQELFQLSDLIHEVIDLFWPTANDKEININYIPSNQTQITADKDILKTILRNLLSNAIKFTHNAGTIKITEWIHLNHLNIAVSDTGIGMDNVSQQKLFNHTINASQRGTENEKGSGLGLALCKELIDKLGGTISVKSELNKGSEFLFSIPISS